MTQCPKCKHVAETYSDVSGGEKITRCAICHHILTRTGKAQSYPHEVKPAPGYRAKFEAQKGRVQK